MRLIHARVQTMAGKTYDDGFVETDGGLITAVGPMEKAGPYDGEAYDLHGALLLPGFVDAHTHLGMFEDSIGFEGDDGNEDTDPCTPHLRAVDAVNPFDRCFAEACAAGVTTVVTGPGSANPIGGQMAAIKTYGRCIDEMIVRAPAAIKLALGENPKSVYHEKNTTPVTRMATAALIREQLEKARGYLDKQEQARLDEEREEPEYDAKCEALLPLFTQGLPVHIHAHRADDICTAVRLAEEFDVSYAIVHCTQGFLLADYLRDKGAAAMCGPLLCDRCKPELRDATPANPGVLSRAGVPVCIVTDHPEVPIEYLPLCAGLAVREGMPYEEALRAITIYPARICGIDGRVGSIEPGKDADLVAFDQDPLTIAARPTLVMTGGIIYREGERAYA